MCKQAPWARVQASPMGLWARPARCCAAGGASHGVATRRAAGLSGCISFRKSFRLLHAKAAWSLTVCAHVLNPPAQMVPRVCVFGGKAASAYYMAKKIVGLILSISETVNNDPDVGDLLKVRRALPRAACSRHWLRPSLRRLEDDDDRLNGPGLAAAPRPLPLELWLTRKRARQGWGSERSRAVPLLGMQFECWDPCCAWPPTCRAAEPPPSVRTPPALLSPLPLCAPCLPRSGHLPAQLQRV